MPFFLLEMGGRGAPLSLPSLFLTLQFNWRAQRTLSSIHFKEKGRMKWVSEKMERLAREWIAPLQSYLNTNPEYWSRMELHWSIVSRRSLVAERMEQIPEMENLFISHSISIFLTECKRSSQNHPSRSDSTFPYSLFVSLLHPSVNVALPFS